ncbi:glycosyltransferase [Thiorhodococcus fuscus]|uniref:Glycosyltransferase n=1 Tax=Thiorhodococcus fuscus TaxID=527200 RepID=A0ABW4Y9U7_9GAMM
MAQRLTDVVETSSLELQILSEAQLIPLRQMHLTARGLAQWSFARRTLQECGGQLFLPFFDHAILGAVLDRRHVEGQISGIIFRPPNAYNYPSSIRHKLDSMRRWGTYLAAHRGAVRRLFTLDEVAPQTIAPSLAGILTFLPDPAPDLSLLHARERRLRTDGRRVFLLFGSLSRRKGIFTILESLLYLRQGLRDSMVLRFVGRIPPQDCEAFMERIDAARNAFPEITIECLNDFVSDETLAQEVIDCDVVLAPYENHIGSSGVLFWATAARKPLISQRTGLIGYQMERYDLGFAVDTTDPRALARALEAANTSGTRPCNDDFLQAHHPVTFTSSLLDELLS